jgi:hypothetical protein
MMVAIPVGVSDLPLDYESISWKDKSPRKGVVGGIDGLYVALLLFLADPHVQLFGWFVSLKYPKTRSDLGFSKKLFKL